MNAAQVKEYTENKPSPISRENLRLKVLFILTAESRLKEIAPLIEKTNEAINLATSPYWLRKHKETMRDLEHCQEQARIILRILEGKRT